MIVVSGYDSFAYYHQDDKNFYKIIHTYNHEVKNEKLISLIEFKNNLLISCFKKLESKSKEGEENSINTNTNAIKIAFHKINFIEEEGIVKDENIIKSYEDIKLSEDCFKYKNILAKFSNSILGVGGEHIIYLINIENYSLVDKYNIFQNSVFCSFYLGEMNTIFMCSRSYKTVSTYDEEFKAYSISICCYQFFEDSMELRYLPQPSKKSREKDPKLCLII